MDFSVDLAAVSLTPASAQSRVLAPLPGRTGAPLGGFGAFVSTAGAIGVDGCEIHFAPGNHKVCWYLQGNHQFVGICEGNRLRSQEFLRCARFRPSTVALDGF